MRHASVYARRQVVFLWAALTALALPVAFAQAGEGTRCYLRPAGNTWYRYPRSFKDSVVPERLGYGHYPTFWRDWHDNPDAILSELKPIHTPVDRKKKRRAQEQPTTAPTTEQPTEETPAEEETLPPPPEEEPAATPEETPQLPTDDLQLPSTRPAETPPAEGEGAATTTPEGQAPAGESAPAGQAAPEGTPPPTEEQPTGEQPAETAPQSTTAPGTAAPTPATGETGTSEGPADEAGEQESDGHQAEEAKPAEHEPNSKSEGPSLQYRKQREQSVARKAPPRRVPSRDEMLQAVSNSFSRPRARAGEPQLLEALEPAQLPESEVEPALAEEAREEPASEGPAGDDARAIRAAMQFAPRPMRGRRGAGSAAAIKKANFVRGGETAGQGNPLRGAEATSDQTRPARGNPLRAQ